MSDDECMEHPCVRHGVCHCSCNCGDGTGDDCLECTADFAEFATRVGGPAWINPQLARTEVER